MRVVEILMTCCLVASANAAPLQAAQCAAVWQQCGAAGLPSCCMGVCTCSGSGSYKQCTPPSGQWQCGTPAPTNAPTNPIPPSPPVPPTPPPAPPTPGPPAKLDIIGYYGNSGNAVAAIPRLAEIHSSYNVLILTFAGADAAGNFSLDIQGPYEHDQAALARDIASWKAQPDPHQRQRLVLFSIGGQNGHWSQLPADKVMRGMETFMDAFHLDGLDVDLEGPSIGGASSLLTVVDALKQAGKVVTAAPEAAYGPLVAYKDLLQHLSWVHPQFYNNGPNAVMAPYVPSAAKWPKPWTVRDWQAQSGGESFWGGVLGAIGNVSSLSASQLGMLVPATTAAAGSYNHWDIDLLVKQVVAAGVKHVGTWAVAYDNTQGWKLGKALETLISTST